MQDRRDFFSMYLEHTSGTECPAFFNRWAAISGIGAYLGRGFTFMHGRFPIHTNMYCMFIGSPGTRKSTSIKLIKSLLKQAGYEFISSEKTSKEKFLQDLSGLESDSDCKAVSLDELNIFGDTINETTDRECYIAADEFNDFIGNGNIEFLSLLGSLWDFHGNYSQRLKNSKSVNVWNPTISILGGNTPTGFALAFPTEILGQGFFSRLLLIYGEPTGKRIAFPDTPDPTVDKMLVEYLQAIKREVSGVCELEPTARRLLEKIYVNWQGLEDVRFDSYSNRRFTHLLKLCMVTAAARLSCSISEQDVVYANTVLSHAEHLMPKALGEFGKSKHSDVVHKIMQMLDAAHAPLQIKELWQGVHNDLDKITELSELLRSLIMADKVQTHNGGFLAKKKILVEVSDDVLDYGLLTREELGK